MTVTKIETVSIPLNKLDLSPINVRRVGREQGLDELAALIDAQGLLNPLSVLPVTKDGEPTGRYGVVAGGRRLLALRLLVKSKRIAQTAPISCSVVAESDAAEISLTENSGRLAMHPADQFEAFAALHASGTGQTVEQIANRYGVAVQTVRQRLRLASVSPVLMERFRAGNLTLEQMMAFAITDDHAAQEQIAELPDYLLSAHSIRARLTQDDVTVSDRRVTFVGLATYTAAGGDVRRDLFSENCGGWLTDPPLLDRLVVEKLEAEAVAVRAEGWLSVDVTVQTPPDLHSMRRARPVEVPLSAEDEEALTNLRQRAEQIEQECGNDGLTDAESAELDGIEAGIARLEGAQESYAPEDLARCGAIVMLGHTGLRIERGLFKSGEDEHAPAAGLLLAPGAAEPKETGLSAAFAGELAAHRTAALQAEVAGRSHLALCILLEALLSPYSGFCNARITSPALHLACPGIEDTDARRLTDPETVGAHVPGGDDMLPWLLDQTTECLVDLLAPLVARGIDAGSKDWTTGTETGAARLARLALLDMRVWWQADATSYFGRVPKSLILAAVHDGAGSAATSDMTSLKKEAMAVAATRRLSDKGWLPTILRVPGGAESIEPVAMAEAAE